MATTVAHLKAILSLDSGRYLRDMKAAETRTQRFGKLAKYALVSGVGAGIYAMGKVAKIGWDEFNQGQKVAAQTNAVLKSTGGVANVTAKDVERLGDRLMRLSGIDDELIKQSANVLLTFRGIRNEVGKGNDIFNQATKAALDVSVAFDKDLHTSSIMVGKALQDPVRGLTALRRVGIQFTDQQEKQIKRMVESGDVMGAQKLILKELEIQAGGSAKALGDTLGGQINILRERFNNWAGEMVEKAIPALQRFGAWAIPIVEKAIAKIGPTIRKIWDIAVTAFKRIREVINENRPAIDRLLRRFGAVAEFLGKILVPVLRFVFTEVLPRYIAIAIKVIDTVSGAIERVIKVARRVVDFFRFQVKPAAVAAFGLVAAKVQGVVDKVIAVIDKLKAMVAYVRSIPGKIKGALGDVGGFFGGLVPSIPGRGDFGSFGLGRTSLVALGRQLQSMGFQVGEHPAFGGVSPVHVPGSYHYSGRALDINWPGAGEAAKLDWLYSRLSRMPGIVELLWRTAGHFDHLHVAMGRGGIVPGPVGMPVPILAHAGETVLPTHRRGWGGLTVNFNGPVYGEERQLETVMQRIFTRYEQRNNRRFGSR